MNNGLNFITLVIAGVNLHATLALVMIILIIALFLVLAFWSNILRVEINDHHAFNYSVKKKEDKTGRTITAPDAPFSLARVQLALWTVIISCSFIYLALCKGDCTDAPINQTALILMGIGASVTVASSVIDKKEIADKRKRYQNNVSEGFFEDILSDANGVSIHRFQNVVWTAIAMVIYLTKVYAVKSGCLLPELSQTLLILTGISSATFVALKGNENSPAVQAGDIEQPQPAPVGVPQTIPPAPPLANPAPLPVAPVTLPVAAVTVPVAPVIVPAAPVQEPIVNPTPSNPAAPAPGTP